jgi:hypothetical protein
MFAKITHFVGDQSRVPLEALGEASFSYESYSGVGQEALTAARRH